MLLMLAPKFFNLYHQEILYDFSRCLTLGNDYPFYVPPSISGTEKVKISTMKVTNMTEMEQRIKMRHAFAMSSFGRMFTPNKISYEMRILCEEWSENIDEDSTC